MSPRGKASLLALALVALGLAAGIAGAEVAQDGTLRISLAAQLSPNRLPRNGRAPVAVSIATRITTTDDSVPPQLKALRIELNRHGRLDTSGLPECRTGQIQPASTRQALAACGAALVGRGRFSLDALLGSQEPYPTTGRLLVFNGRYQGRHALLGQIYSAHPFTNSFVVPFRISRRRGGRYGIVLTARLPGAFTSWGHITGMRLRLGRRYRFRGRRRAFASAGCPAPGGFRSALFPLARASLSFAGGQTLSQTLISSCRVSG